jgi:DNA modification methylase
MATKEGDLILDPMSGSGTTGVVAQRTGRKAILVDHSDSYTEKMESRLALKRIEAPPALRSRSAPVESAVANNELAAVATPV